MNAVTLTGFAVVLCLAVPRHSTAQPSATGTGGFANLNIGIQEGPQTLALAVPADVFGSRGTLAIDDGVSGGNVVDVSGGLRARGFAVGVGYSRFSTKGAQDFTATTGPLDFRRSWSDITPDLEHTERMVYVFAGLTKQITDRFDLMVLAGPAFFTVTRDVPVAASVTDRPIEARIETGRVEESAIGVVTGLDFNFMVRPHVGLGVLVHYSWGSIELSDGTKSMTLGGLQVGAGLRLRL